MKKLLLFPLLFILTLSSNFAQPWMQNISEEKRESGQISYSELQQAFAEYWNGKDVTNPAVISGNGWKAFKRWEYFTRSRVNANVNTSKIIWEENQKKNASKNKAGVRTAWESVGPFDVTFTLAGNRRGQGRVNAIAFHPSDPNIIWVGIPKGGVWKSTTGGNSWTSLTDFLPQGMGISDIVVDPVNPDNLYVATGDADAQNGGGPYHIYSFGIIKSNDGGQTWLPTAVSMQMSQEMHIARIVLDPNNPSVQVATSTDGIYRTTDAWQTYSMVQTGNYCDLDFQPGNFNVIFAARYGNGKIYRSTDAGLTFTKITSTLPTSGVQRVEFTVTPNNSQIVYAVFSKPDASFHSFYKSTDGGEIWTKTFDGVTKNLLGRASNGMDFGVGQGWYDLCIAASPNNANEVYVGGINVWKSTNGGTSWILNAHWTGDGAPYMHADHHDLVYSPNDVLYCGNDGGIYKKGTPTTWDDLSTGLTILEIYRMSSSATTPNLYLTGAQDNGTFRHSDGEWKSVLGGDGMDCLIDHTNPQIMFGEMYNGYIYKSTNGGNTFGNNYLPIPEAGEGDWVTPYVMHPTNHLIMYAGFKKVYKSTNSGSSWTAISDNLSGTLIALAVAPSNPNYIYAASISQIFKTTDGGENWSNITLGLPTSAQGEKTFITVSQNDPEKLWVSHSGYTDGAKIYMSTNAGTTWINYSQGLPNLPTNCVIYQNNTNDALYAGTDMGVYYRNADMTKWIDYSTNLPNVIVSEIEIHYNTQKLIAATFGRGMWRTEMVTIVPPIVSDAGICIGEPIPTITATGTDIKWYSDPDLTNLLAIGETYTPTVTELGTYTYYVTQTINGVESIAYPVDFRISEIPESPTLLSTESSVCFGSTTTFYAISGSNINWYADTELTTLINNGTTFQPTETEPNQYHYYVTQNPYNCESLATVITFTINALPPSPTASDVAVCWGEDIVLTAEGGEIRWFSDSTLINYLSSGNTYTPSISAPGTYTYYASQLVNNCQSAGTKVTLTVNETAKPTAGNTNACFGATQFDLNAAGENITWYSDSTMTTVLGNGNIFNPTVSEIGTYYYYATQTANNCESGVTQVVLTISQAVAPVANNSTACTTAAIPALTAVGSNLKWYSDIALTTQVGQGESFVTGQTAQGTYTYYVTQTVDNCESQSVIATLTLQQPAVSNFTYTTNYLEVTFTNTSENATEYSWNFGDNSTVSTLQSPEPHTYSASGHYDVTLSAANAACGATNYSSNIYVEKLGISGTNTENLVLVVPNPNKGIFELRYVSQNNSKITIAIFDAKGQKVYNKKVHTSNGTATTTIDLRNQSKGVYNIQIIDNQKIINQKMLLE